MWLCCVGFYEYGSRYEESIVEVVRQASEHCDALQSFFLLHSMGGGTGSGLGTRVLNILHEHFPDIYRLVNNAHFFLYIFVLQVNWQVFPDDKLSFTRPVVRKAMSPKFLSYRN